jgi:hypothetical protein
MTVLFISQRGQNKIAKVTLLPHPSLHFSDLFLFLNLRNQMRMKLTCKDSSSNPRYGNSNMGYTFFGMYTFYNLNI